MSSSSTAFPLRPRSSANTASVAAITCVEFFETGLVVFSASRIMGGLGLTPAQFALVYTLYGVASIFMLFKHQWMVERFGYRDFILASLALFAVGGALCATAEGFGQFALGRALQGAAGATFFTAGRMHVNQLPPDARFGGMLAFIGSLLGASAIAPLAAAALLGAWDWRALFWASLPLALAVAWIAAPRLPRETTPPAERSHEHWGWLLWMALGVFGLQYAIETIPREAGASRLDVLALGLASILALAVFAWRQWTKERPLIDYRGLFQRRYLFGLTLYFFGYFMIGASGFLLPIFLHAGLSHSLLFTAAAVSACTFASTVTAIGHVVLVRRRPRLRGFMLGGLALYAAGLVLLARPALWTSAPGILLPLLVTGIAIPLFLGSVAFGTFTELDAKVFSHGYQVKNIVRQLGLSSSIALATLALQSAYARQSGTGTAVAAWEQVLHGLQTTAGSTLLNPLTQANREVFLLLAALTLPVMLVVSVQRIFR